MDNRQWRFIRHLMIAACGLALVAFAALFAYSIARVFLLIFAGIVVAVFLRGCGVWVAARLHLPPGAGVALVILGFLAFFGLSFVFLEPRVAAQFGALQVSIPQELNQLTSGGQGEWRRLIGTAGTALIRDTQPFTRISEWVVDIFVLAFIAVYLAFQPTLYRNGLLWLTPQQDRTRVADILDGLENTLWRWFVGRIIGMAVIGILVYFGAWGVGLPLAFTLALMAAVFEFVPYAGAIVSSIPALLLAFSQGMTTVWLVVVLYLLVHGIDGYVVIPLVERRAVRIAPALTIVAQVAMFSTAGLLGVLIADPLVAVILVLLEMFHSPAA